MKKKMMSLLMVGAMAVGMLAGCGGKGREDKSAGTPKVENGTGEKGRYVEKEIAFPEGVNKEDIFQIGKKDGDMCLYATVKKDGNRVTITDKNGFKMSFLLEEGFQKDANANPPESGVINLEVTDIGTMTLHIGANKDQNMEVSIPRVSSESLYIDDLDVTTVKGADRAITRLDEAIAEVSAVRSKIGAYENRLDYSTASLDTYEENITDALSRLSDTDMADEMTTYTQQNILSQATISVLTQANDLPQQVLQLLQ